MHGLNFNYEVSYIKVDCGLCLYILQMYIARRRKPNLNHIPLLTPVSYTGSFLCSYTKNKNYILIYAQNKLMKIHYIIYGLCGLCMEILWTGIGSLTKGDLTLSGYSSIWMFLIYGMFVFIEPLHEKIRDKPLILRGGVYTILIFSGEFISGILLKTILGKCPWNYGTSRYSILGIITLKYIPVWFALGLLFEIFHDFLADISASKKKIL